jgi:hypothetical protein
MPNLHQRLRTYAVRLMLSLFITPDGFIKLLAKAFCIAFFDFSAVKGAVPDWRLYFPKRNLRS